MSNGESAAPPVILPADLAWARGKASEEHRRWRDALAVAAAALLHAVVILSFIWDWERPAAPPAEPVPVPVNIVFVPPEPAPAAPPPKPAALGYRESGKDQRTTAPPPAETVAPKPAALPPAAAEPEPSPKEAPPPESRTGKEESAKPKPRHEVARLEPQKRPAESPRAPQVAPTRRLDIAPGERVETGDPYLNRLQAEIERHRVYPRVLGQFGLPVEGTAVYDILVERSGRLVDFKLEHSSGTPGIDRAVEGMIRDSTPFPPLPSDYPDRVGIVIAIRLFPPS